jgi:hypothetical protein
LEHRSISLEIMHENRFEKQLYTQIGCLQWRKFGISVDGQVGRK